MQLFKKQKKQVSRIDIIFCTDAHLLSLNQVYLNHDYFTDTISFPLSLSNEPLQGEIYISVQRIIDNAKRFKISYQQELIRVIIHSCLHFCGYKDDSAHAASKMHIQQEKYLQAWNVSRETQIGR